MITVARNNDTYSGLSTDTKPLFARNGDLFTEIDTGTNYMFDAESGDWTEVDLGGGGVTPTGEIEIVQNGTFDVSSYASADVNVPTSGLDNYYKGLIERTATSLVLPSSLTTIGKYAFFEYANLVDIELNDNITSIGDYAFANSPNVEITELPSALTSIGDSTFSGCYKLVLTELPSGVTNISKNAFSGCTGLTHIVIPSGVTSIERGLFNKCSNLESIELPSGITSIGISAFNACRKLMEFICRAVNPPTLDSSALSGVPANCAIYVPAGSVDAYKAAANWSARADYIQAIQA